MPYALIEEFNACLSRMSSLTEKPGMAIALTRRGLREHLEVINELRRNIFRKYGTEDKDGNLTVQKDSENYDDFVREMSEFLNEKAEVEIYQVPADGFTIDGIYCETAKAQDYELFELLMVEHPEDKTNDNSEVTNDNGG